MSKKVIAAGHICLDITPVFPERRVNQPSDLSQPVNPLPIPWYWLCWE